MKTARILLSSAIAAGALLFSAARAEAAPSEITQTFCRDTNNPGVILENDDAQLIWDEYGNLTLINHVGNGTKHTWGLGSDVPLTTSPATLCFGSDGNLRITRSDGTEVWKSSTTTTSNASLYLQHCSVATGAGNVVPWAEWTPVCNRPTLKKPTSANKCFTADDTILWSEEEEYGLRWSSGRLVFVRDRKSLWTSNGIGAGRQLCYQTDGNLVIYSSTGSVVWAAGSNNAANTMMAMDRCGFSFSSTPNPLDQYKRFSALSCDMDTIREGWTRTIGAPGNIIANENVRFDWNPDGHLKLWSSDGALLWNSPNKKAGQRVEFQGDGNLVIYSSNNTPLWAYTDETDGMHVLSEHIAALTLSGCSVSVVDTTPVACEFRVDDVMMRRLDCPQINMPWTKAPATCTAGLSGGGFAFLRDERAGDSRFGAETWVVASAVNGQGVNALKTMVAPFGRMASNVAEDLPTGTPPSDFNELLAAGGASVTLFGENSSIVEANAYTGLSQGPKARFVFRALGFDVKESSATSLYEASAEATFFEAEETFFVGFIPITLAAGVEGNVGAKFNAWYDTANGNVLRSTITPSAGLDLTGSVSIGGGGVSAGVETSLELVTVGVPFTSSLDLSNKAYTFTGDINVSTLSGEVELFAKLGLLKAKKKLASWDGYSASMRLFTRSGSL